MFAVMSIFSPISVAFSFPGSPANIAGCSNVEFEFSLSYNVANFKATLLQRCIVTPKQRYIGNSAATFMQRCIGNKEIFLRCHVAIGYHTQLHSYNVSVTLYQRCTDNVTQDSFRNVVITLHLLPKNVATKTFM